jgi:transcriptional regulator with XRE-family HTH domain
MQELKILMLKNKMSQLELARKLGIHPSTINLAINHYHTLPDVYIPAFCKILGIDPVAFAEGNIKETKDEA